MGDAAQNHRNPWPHRMAVSLACATFPLIWIGGLVTTYDAGMAVPDWPSTYGYNLFLYPISTWVAGPWDLFIEHGHRLIASFVGLVSIAMAIVTWRFDSRRWVRYAALGAVALVVFQGVLGGLRVLLVDRQIAQVHGIVGPIFFAYCIFLTVVTSRLWQEATSNDRKVPITIRNLAWGLSGLAFAQLLFGSQLRHVSGMTSPALFGWAVKLHVLFACVLLFLAPYLSRRVFRNGAARNVAHSPAIVLSFAIGLQVLMGIGAWFVKYGVPAILVGRVPPISVEANSMIACLMATAHVANGALILGAATLMAVRLTRFACTPQTARADVVVGAAA